MKALVNLMCCFVPKKKWRKEIRYRLVYSQVERRELLDAGLDIIEDAIKRVGKQD